MEATNNNLKNSEKIKDQIIDQKKKVKNILRQSYVPVISKNTFKKPKSVIEKIMDIIMIVIMSLLIILSIISIIKDLHDYISFKKLMKVSKSFYNYSKGVYSYKNN